MKLGSASKLTWWHVNPPLWQSLPSDIQMFNQSYGVINFSTKKKKKERKGKRERGKEEIRERRREREKEKEQKIEKKRK